MNHIARQASSTDTGTSPTSIGNTDTGAPSTAPTISATSTPSTTDVPATGTSTSDSTAATVSDITPAASESSTNTAAVSTPNSTAPPTSQAIDQTITSGGASDASITATSLTELSQSQQTGISSKSGLSGSLSLTSSITSTDSASESLTSSATTSDTSASPSSTPSTPSGTTSTTQSSSSTESTSFLTTSDSSSIDPSSSPTKTSSRSTSLTTSYTEVISTIDGQVTTIFSPVATLNADTSSTLTSSNRTAIIAGSTAAGVALLILCLLTVFLCRRHQKRRGDQSHRYLPTPRSVMLAGEDDFDLAGHPRPERGFEFLGPRKTRNFRAEAEYRDLGSDSGRGANSPEMREPPSEPPPRLLRPVASKTGSYFQEAVWPPPEEGSRLRDPLMAASNVDLHSIVDEVMGTGAQGQLGLSSAEGAGASTSSLPRPSRLRGGAADSSSFSNESGTPTDFGFRIPTRHIESLTISSIDSGFGDSPRHLRDWSTDSATGLLATMEGSMRSPTWRNSGSSGGAWLPAGAAPLSVYGRPMSPHSPLRVVTEPPSQVSPSPTAAASVLASGKAREAAQERRSSLAIANPNPSPEEETPSSSMHAPSFSVSTTSTQRLRRLAGTLETTGEETPYPDESPIERRSVPLSLAHAWLLDADDYEEEDVRTPRPGPRPQEEIPPRYDMIRRDSEDGLPTTMRTRTF